MSAAFFGLALLAALNPKLLAVDLLLVDNRRPRLMFGYFLLGGMGLGLAVGFLDVFVLHADAVKTQGSVSAGLDLGLGVPLLAIGVLLATGHLHRRRKAHAPAGNGKAAKGEGWVQRVLREPRFGLAVLIGAVVGTRALVTSPHYTSWSRASPPPRPRPWRSLSSSSSSSRW